MSKHAVTLLFLTICYGFEVSPECRNIVSAEDIQFYDKNGYVMIPNLLESNQLNNLQNAYQKMFNRRLVEGDQLQGKWKGDWDESIDNHYTENVTSKMYSIHDVEYHDNIFSKLILFNDKIGCYLELGTHSLNVVLHHTKAHWKPSKTGAAFPAHQDYHYFPYEKHSMVAIFVHLDDTDKENGGLIIWPESQANGPQFDKGWHDGTGYHYLDAKQFPFESGQSVTANAGDAVMFHYLTVHASYPNKSDRERRMVLVQGVSVDDKPLSMIHRHSKGQGIVLRGINPNVVQTSHYKRHDVESEIIEGESKDKTDL